MSTLKLEVEVSKETYEVGECAAKLVAAVKTALADGWQPGMDIPAIAFAAMNELGTAVKGADKIDDEYAENKSAFFNAVSLGFSGALGGLLK